LHSLSVPDQDPTLSEIQLLHPQTDALRKPQTAAVEQLRHELRSALHATEDFERFVLGRHGVGNRFGL